MRGAVPSSGTRCANSSTTLRSRSPSRTPPGEPALERQRDEHHLPAAIDVADTPLVTDLHAVEERDVHALAGERADLLQADAGCVHGNQEEGETGVLRAVGAGSGEQEDPVRFLGDAGEHLLAVDTPCVAVADGSRARGGDVGPGVGLGVAEADHRLAREETREYVVADHLVPDVGEHRRHHHHVAQAVVRRARALELGEQRGELLGVAPAAALGLGQRLRDPAALADRPVQRPAVDRAGLAYLVSHVVGEVGRDHLPHFFPESLSRLRRPEVHQRAAREWSVASGGEALVFADRRVEDERPALRAAVVELDVVLLHVAVAAVEVQRAFRGALRRLCGEQERHRGQVGRVGARFVDGPRGLAGEELRAVERNRDVGERVLDRLERADRLAELVAFCDVRACDGQRARTQTGQHGARSDSAIPIERALVAAPRATAPEATTVAPAMLRSASGDEPRFRTRPREGRS